MTRAERPGDGIYPAVTRDRTGRRQNLSRSGTGQKRTEASQQSDLHQKFDQVEIVVGRPFKGADRNAGRIEALHQSDSQQLVSLARTISSRDSNSQTTDKNRQLKAHVCVVNLSISFEVEFLPKRKKTNIVETRVKVLPVSPCVCCLYLWPEKAILKKKTVLCLVKTFTRYQFGPRTYETRERKKEKKTFGTRGFIKTPGQLFRNVTDYDIVSW